MQHSNMFGVTLALPSQANVDELFIAFYRRQSCEMLFVF